MKQKGLNREMLRLMYGDDVNLFEKRDLKNKVVKSDENQNMTRILVWPNITFDIERLHQDSYVQTIYKMISQLYLIFKKNWLQIFNPKIF